MNDKGEVLIGRQHTKIDLFKISPVGLSVCLMFDTSAISAFTKGKVR